MEGLLRALLLLAILVWFCAVWLVIWQVRQLGRVGAGTDEMAPGPVVLPIFTRLGGPGFGRRFGRIAWVLVTAHAGAVLVMMAAQPYVSVSGDLMPGLLFYALVPEWDLFPVWWLPSDMTRLAFGALVAALDCLPIAAVIASYGERSRISLFVRFAGPVLLAAPVAVWFFAPQNQRLSGADLRGRAMQSAQFHYADLSRARMDSADLTGSATDPHSEAYASSGTHGDYARLLWRDFSGADMVGADLRGADLRWAFLCSARLDGASLRRVHAPSAELSSLSMSGVDLTEANLRGADLSESDLAGACLERADLTDASLFRCKLERARLTGLCANSASFSEANMRQANLEGSDLRGAGLRDSNLSFANLRGANLAGAAYGGTLDLRGANLEGADLRTLGYRGVLSGEGQVLLAGATYDGKTQVPAGVDLSRMGAIRRP